MPRVIPIYDESIDPATRVKEDQEPEGPQPVLCVSKMWHNSVGCLESLEVFFYDNHEILWMVKYDGALVSVGGSLWENLDSLYARAKKLPEDGFNVLWHPVYDPVR